MLIWKHYRNRTAPITRQTFLASNIDILHHGTLRIKPDKFPEIFCIGGVQGDCGAVAVVDFSYRNPMVNTAPFRLGWVILLSWFVATVLATSCVDAEWFFGSAPQYRTPSFLLAIAWILLVGKRIYLIIVFLPAAFLFVKIKWFWARFILAFAICAYPSAYLWFPIGKVQTPLDTIGFVVGVSILVLFSFSTARYIGSRHGAISHCKFSKED